MTLTNRYDDALRFAAELHRQQKRKGGAIPYLSHLLATSALVMEHGGDEDQAIAALLHDAIEDQGQHYPGGVDALRDEIERRYGPQVAAIVQACSDAHTHPKPPWRQRKEDYIAHLATAPLPVLRVSCADKLHNARCILADYRQLGEVLWQRFHADRAQVLWYYRALVDAFRGTVTPAGLVVELEHAVDEVERLCR